MATQVQMVNRALTLCGAARIISIQDDTKSGRAIEAVYEGVRDDCLATANWKFAMRRFVAQLTTAPLFDWTYAYVIPAEILRLVEIRDIMCMTGVGPRYIDQPQRVYEIEEDGKILTNINAPLNCRGVARITSEARFDPLFATYFIHCLAVAVWEDVSRKSATKKQDIERERDRSLRIARARDAIMEPPEELPDESWLLARIGP